MAYDRQLADRVRALIGDDPGYDEKAMMGGLAMLLEGNMAVAVSSRGGLMVRVGPEGAKQALERPHTERVDMGGRRMRGWVRVAGAGLDDEAQLREWVELGAGMARSLPPK